MNGRRLLWVVALFLGMWALAATAAHACTGFLVRDRDGDGVEDDDPAAESTKRLKAAAEHLDEEGL